MAFIVLVVLWFLWRGDDCSVLQTIDLGGGARVQIVDDACKEGLPHTTDKHTIRMTRGIWESDRREEILRHERAHLAQRGSLRDWYDFYKGAWGYTCSASPPSGLPAEYIARLRPNPDTADSPWALWRNRWLFFPAYTAAGTLKDAEVIVWDTEMHRESPIPDAWRSFFCEGDICPHQYEHPHEISAEWITTPIKSKAAKLLEKMHRG